MLAMAILIPCMHAKNILSVVLTIIGFAALADLLLDALRERDHTGVFLLLWLLIPVPIAYYGHLRMKYLPPCVCVPALILVWLSVKRRIFAPVCPIRGDRTHCGQRWLFGSDHPVRCGVRFVRPLCHGSPDQTARCCRRNGMVWGPILDLLVRAAGWGKTYFPGWTANQSPEICSWWTTL
jgi:hypothetical protein